MMKTTPSDQNRDSADAIGARWQLDPRRSSVEFRAGHLWGLVTVKGHFDEFQGRLDLRADPAIELTIDAASVDSRNRKRDRHLRSGDFFDVENHPQVRFLSEQVVLLGETLKVRGSLAAAGRSIPLELDARVREVDGELEIDAATTAPHRELGMKYSPLRMIRPRSQLLVKAVLRPDNDGADCRLPGW
jgi:polyisoprenoid-binding protein YceI